jgi:hypothetical protein
LLPTITHALSGYIYSNAESPSLKTKLRKFLQFGSDDAEGDTDDDWDTHQEENMPQAKRFDIMAAGLWGVLQMQILKTTSMPKLERLELITTCSSQDGSDHDENLFSSQTSEDRAFDDMFDDTEEEDEEEMLEELQYLNEDELLFNRPDAKRYETGDEDLFEGDVRPHNLSSDLLSPYCNVQDDKDEDRDELLLDLMLDDGCYRE